MHKLTVQNVVIKIWFQNRRTKWKRKYTNDVEILAQQYYSSLGSFAPRPMFLGDRLWLFNYQSNPYHHHSIIPFIPSQFQSQNYLQSSNITQNSQTVLLHQFPIGCNQINLNENH
ncbi:nk homeobox protein, putative [Pediculus humanus corporis]|uniref:Nk homeobox protein, putative n=1 Tax=Pediculus humanus subsp. corporis TaxID=121224 RepID=E0VDL4_PEDHC|nr:nk homeobox protein, putative [Pediculus humanus corporis]EEB11470.1 nk homeobox protein, putative [Pediculus humanus corporis]